MCRSIKVLRHADLEPTSQEIHEAALQYVRKVSEFRKPSKANQDAFNLAVIEISAVTERLMEKLVVRGA